LLKEVEFSVQVQGFLKLLPNFHASITLFKLVTVIFMHIDISKQALCSKKMQVPNNKALAFSKQNPLKTAKQYHLRILFYC